jgi:hypothetical protein
MKKSGVCKNIPTSYLWIIIIILIIIIGYLSYGRKQIELFEATLTDLTVNDAIAQAMCYTPDVINTKPISNSCTKKPQRGESFSTDLNFKLDSTKCKKNWGTHQLIPGKCVPAIGWFAGWQKKP